VFDFMSGLSKSFPESQDLRSFFDAGDVPSQFHFPFIFQLKAPANLLFAALRLIRFALETAQFFQHAEPGEGRRGLVGGLSHKCLSVKQNFPGRIELLQEIKIKNIAGQHGAAMLSSCGK